MESQGIVECRLVEQQRNICRRFLGNGPEKFHQAVVEEAVYFNKPHAVVVSVHLEYLFIFQSRLRE